VSSRFTLRTPAAAAAVSRAAPEAGLTRGRRTLTAFARRATLPVLTALAVLAAALRLSLPRRMRGARLVRGTAFGVGAGAEALLGLSRADFGDALGTRHLELLARAGRIVEVGHRHARQPPADGALDAA
jgi:hypothetical protein